MLFSIDIKTDPVRELLANTEHTVPGSKVITTYETMDKAVTFVYPEFVGGRAFQATNALTEIIRKNQKMKKYLGSDPHIQVGVTDNGALFFRMKKDAFEAVYNEKIEAESLKGRMVDSIDTPSKSGPDNGIVKG